MLNTIANQRLQFDVLRVPLLGSFLRWKHGRTAVQTLLFLLAAVIVVAMGPGATTLAVIDRLANSRATERVSPRSPALDAA